MNGETSLAVLCLINSAAIITIGVFLWQNCRRQRQPLQTLPLSTLPLSGNASVSSTLPWNLFAPLTVCKRTADITLWTVDNITNITSQFLVVPRAVKVYITRQGNVVTLMVTTFSQPLMATNIENTTIYAIVFKLNRRIPKEFRALGQPSNAINYTTDVLVSATPIPVSTTPINESIRDIVENFVPCETVIGTTQILTLPFSGFQIGPSNNLLAIPTWTATWIANC